MDKDLRNKIKFLIDKNKSGIEICNTLGIEMPVLFMAVKELNESGYPCFMDGDIPVKIKGPYSNEANATPDVVEFCFISDLHLGSIYDRLDILRRIYSECRRRGVKKIFCSGDITDGEYPKRPHYAEHQAITGYDNMVNYVCKSLPTYQDITMYAISGNHDDSYSEGESESILSRISSIRKDFIYLGKNEATLTIDNTLIKLMHGYKRKKHVNMDERLLSFYERIPENVEKPDILSLGHIHTSGVRKFDNTLVLQCGSLMDTPEFVDKDLYDTDKCCFFVKVYHDDYGRVIDTEVDYISFREEMVRKRVKDYTL